MDLDRIIHVIYGDEYADDYQKLAGSKGFRWLSTGAHRRNINFRFTHDFSFPFRRSFGGQDIEKKVNSHKPIIYCFVYFYTWITRLYSVREFLAHHGHRGL